MFAQCFNIINNCTFYAFTNCDSISVFIHLTCLFTLWNVSEDALLVTDVSVIDGLRQLCFVNFGIQLLSECHKLAPTSATDWLQRPCHVLSADVYVIMHIKDPSLSVVRVVHGVPLAGLCRFLYRLHALNRDVDMIKTKTNKNKYHDTYWSHHKLSQTTVQQNKPSDSTDSNKNTNTLAWVTVEYSKPPYVTDLGNNTVR